RRRDPSADEAPLAQVLESLVQERSTLRAGAALLHVRQMGLVDLGRRRGGRVVLVTTGGQPAAGALPLVGHLDPLTDREGRTHLVAVRAPVGDVVTGRRLTALALTGRTGPDAGATDRVSS